MIARPKSRCRVCKSSTSLWLPSRRGGDAGRLRRAEVRAVNAEGASPWSAASVFMDWIQTCWASRLNTRLICQKLVNKKLVVRFRLYRNTIFAEFSKNIKSNFVSKGCAAVEPCVHRSRAIHHETYCLRFVRSKRHTPLSLNDLHRCTTPQTFFYQNRALTFESLSADAT